MKTSYFALLLSGIVIVLLAAPASAGVLYDNGPINGTIYNGNYLIDPLPTLNVNIGVTDSFTLTGSSTVNGFRIGLWESPNDVPRTVDWLITSQPRVNPPYGGTIYGSGTASLSNAYQFTNSQGYWIYESTASIAGVNLGPGTYWFQLQNATDNSGHPDIGWDRNDGPSIAYQTFVSHALDGSESFQILGTTATPEPGTLLLLGSGVLGLAGVVRRKLKL